MKLINAGRILENSRTLGESRLPVAEVPGGVITMHVVVRPPIHDKNNGESRLPGSHAFFFFSFLFFDLVLISQKKPLLIVHQAEVACHWLSFVIKSVSVTS